ncbi:MAG: PQQ-binding-like beta-propeller repeat protein, partial [Gemmataceae bacterium]
SIMISVVGGVRQYVTQTMASAVGVNADTGKLLWKTGEIGRRVAVIPSPVLSQDDFVFFTAGYGAGCECLQMVPSDAGVTAKILYTKRKTVANHHGGVIGHEGNIFGHSDAGGWTCYPMKAEKDEATWQSSKLGKGSISYADGHFYCYSEDKGNLVRIKASSEGWEENGRFTIPATSTKRPKSGKVWAHPVIAQGKLFLRDYELLYVYDLKAK